MDIVAMLKESFEVSKRSLVIFVPNIAVAVVMFLLTIVFVGGSAATMAIKGGDLSTAAYGTMIGGALFVGVIAMLLGFIACAMTIAMAQEALTTGTTSLNTGIVAGKQSLVNVVIAAILMSIVVGIGFVLLVIPGLVAIVFLIFTLPAVVLENYGAVDAMKKSYEIVKANAGDVITLAVVIFGLAVAMAIVSAVFNIIPFLGQLVSMTISLTLGSYLTVLIVRAYGVLKARN